MKPPEQLVRIIAGVLREAEGSWTEKAEAAIDAMHGGGALVLPQEGGVFSALGMVKKDGTPFVQTYVNDVPFGQLSPGEAQASGLRIIAASIEAERDSGMIRYLQKSDFGEEQINALITDMRDNRDQHDPPEGRTE